MIGKIEAALKTEMAKDKGALANVLADKNALMAIQELDGLAGADVDFQGYVARELNKRPSLDGLFALARKIGMKSPALAATYAVADTVKVHDRAKNVLREVLYPRMKQQPDGGAGIDTLFVVEGLLRSAQEPADLNGALQLAIDHFLNKPDHRLPKRGHREFALELQGWLMH
jgi:hypothetical protein